MGVYMGMGRRVPYPGTRFQWFFDGRSELSVAAYWRTRVALDLYRRMR